MKQGREKCRLWVATVTLSVFFIMSTASAQFLNDRPMVGVLAEEIAWSLLDRYEDLNPFSHIAASYVKFIEGGGARPVPIWIGKSKDYYKDIMGKINGWVVLRNKFVFKFVNAISFVAFSFPAVDYGLTRQKDMRKQEDTSTILQES